MDNSAKHGVTAVVEYDYKAKETDELDLVKGAIIHSIRKQPGGWWLGTLATNGKTGMFPDNFVRLLDNSDDKSPVVLRPKADTIHRKCKVVYSYTQNNEDELSLAVGDVIEILGVVEEGWWRGRLNDKIGVFPSNFVVPIEASPILAIRKSNNLATTIQQQSQVATTALTNTLPTTNSIKTENHSNLHSSTENLLGSSSKLNKAIIKDKDKDAPLLPPKPQREFCRVMYPYEPQNDDELELQIGDIILIQSKELPDKGWWRGELRGKVGVFPDNFVTILPPDFSPNKDNSHLERPTGGINSATTNSSKVFIKKSGSGSSTQSTSNRKDSFGSRDSLNDILSETGLQTGNVAAQRKSLESKNLDLTNNIVTAAGLATVATAAVGGGGNLLNDANKHFQSSARNKTSTTTTTTTTATSVTQHHPTNMDSSQKNSDVRKSLENIDEKKTPPPVLTKKPIVPVKKSTSVTSVAGNILSGIKHKVKSVEQKLHSHDSADGITSSKIITGQQIGDLNEKNVNLERISINRDSGGEFDNVERTSMLGDMRASRVKAPKRRPPSAAINIIGESNNNETVYLNGSSTGGNYLDQYEMNKGDISPTNTTSEPVTIGDSEELVKPKPREWEKMKAPWMAELKANQEKKKISPQNIDNKPETRTSISEKTTDSSSGIVQPTTTGNKLVNSNVQRKSIDASHSHTTNNNSIESHKKDTTNNGPSAIHSIHSNQEHHTKPITAGLRTSISHDIDDVKHRPNSLSIRNRSASPSGRASINKAISLDVQQNLKTNSTTITTATTAATTSLSSSTTHTHSNTNSNNTSETLKTHNINATQPSHSNSIHPPLAGSNIVSNSITSSTTGASATAHTINSNNSLPISTSSSVPQQQQHHYHPINHENVCTRVTELEQRLHKLETIVQSQNKIIENLVGTLREETDKVKGLKTELDKYAQCVTQV